MRCRLDAPRKAGARLRARATPVRAAPLGSVRAALPCARLRGHRFASQLRARGIKLARTSTCGGTKLARTPACAAPSSPCAASARGPKLARHPSVRAAQITKD